MVNPCIICGKERVIKKTYKEKVGDSTITHTTMICPDRNCQKKVDTLLAKEKAKRQFFKTESENREKIRLHRVQVSRIKNRK